MSNARILSKIPSDLANNIGKILVVNSSSEYEPQTNYGWITANSAFSKANSSITLGTTPVYLGSSNTSIAGLTLTGSYFNGTVGATTVNTGAFTTLSASSQISGTGSTAALPAFTFVGDTNTGIYSPGADQLAFATGGIKRLNIDSSGTVTVTNSLIANTISAGSISTVLDLTWNSDTDTYSRSTETTPTQRAHNIHNNMRRCLLNDSGQVVYYLNTANSALKADGTNSVLTGADGQVMVEIPQTFVKYTNVSNTHTWSISDAPLPGYELHPAFIVDNQVVTKRYIGAYDACVLNTTSGLYESGLNYDVNVGGGQNWNISTYKLGSVSGIYPAVGIYRSDSRSLSANRGTRWRQLDFHLMSLVQLLYLMEYGSFNAQAKISNGNVEVATGYPTSSGTQTDSPHSVSGKSNSIGNGTGGVNSTTRDTAWMSYRGIENLFGNCWTWIDGINFSDGTVYVCNSNIRTNFADDTTTNYTSIGSKIQSDGYPTKILSYPYGFIPTTVGGSTTTYLSDYYWQSTGWRMFIFGSDANRGGSAGVFCLSSYDSAAIRDRDIGARLVF